MVRINPNFEEPVFECFIAYLEELYIAIEQSTPDKHNMIIHKIIDNYYKERLDTKNPFSEKFLTNIITNIIKEIWEVNEDDFKITEETKNRIFEYLLDVFIKVFSEYPRTEIKD